MITERLPWDSISGPRYTPRVLKPRKKWVTYGSWFMSCLLILGGLTTRYRVAAVFGLLYLLALIMKKDTAVTNRGLEIYYQMRITTHYDFWGWDEINAIVREDRNHPELVCLHIGFGNREKALYFTRSEAKEIIALAKQRNPAIRVMDAEVGARPGPSKKANKKHKKR